MEEYNLTNFDEIFSKITKLTFVPIRYFENNPLKPVPVSLDEVEYYELKKEYDFKKQKLIKKHC